MLQRTIYWSIASMMTLFLANRAFADWPYAQHDPGDTCRTNGAGTVSSDPSSLPGQLALVSIPDLALDDTLLIDIDGDAVADVVTIMQGKIAAYSGIGGGTLWATPILRATDIVGIVDLVGDGDPSEIVGVSGNLSGGVYVVDLYTGGLLWDFGPTDNRSGVDARELVAVDLDGDGIEELVFTEDYYGNDGIFVANFATGLATPDVLETVLPGGYVNLTPMAAGNLFNGSGGVLVQQFGDLALFEVCDAADVDAVCSPLQSICLCDRGLFVDVHPSFSWGSIWAQDVDGNGVDEVVEIQDSTRYGSQLSVFDIEAGLGSGVPVAEDLVRWTYNYGYSSPETVIVALDGELRDLDGDGDPDLAVTFYDNTTDEQDFSGAPSDDGIDHPDAFSVGVFDASTGELVAQIEDVYLWAIVDVDGNGLPELITTPTSGWSFQTGLTAYELECDPSCIAQVVWDEPDHTPIRDLEQQDGAGFPTPQLHVIDIDQDGALDVLAWDGVHLDAMQLDGTSMTVTSSLLPTDSEDVAAVSDDGAYLLLNSGTDTRLLDASLQEVATTLVTGGQAIAEVVAVQFEPGNPRATMIVNGAVFWTDPSPTDLGDADLQMLPHLFVVEDLTGDGFVELVSVAQPDESPDGRLLVETYSYDPTDPDGDGTPFGLLWSYSASTEPDLDGYEINNASDNLVRAGDVDGDGGLDIVFALFAGALYESAVLILDGETGALMDIYDVDFINSARRIDDDVPLWLEDFVDGTGAESPDGLDDLMLSDMRDVFLVPGGQTEAVGQYSTDKHQWEAMYVDLDEDGVTEVVLLKDTGEDAQMVTGQITGALNDFWASPAELEGMDNPSDETLAVVVKDGDGGFDIVYLSGTGSLEVREGDDGSLAPGYPVYLFLGALSQTEDSSSTALSAVAVADIDGDGFDEVLAGGDDGYLYAVNVHESEPSPRSLEWTFYVGTSVSGIRVADVDGDGWDEVLVVGPDSTVRVLDGLGVYIEITDPQDGSCLPSTEFTVSGMGEAIETVDVYISGVLAVSDAPVTGGVWEAPGVVASGMGTWSVEAEGKDVNGLPVIYDQILVVVDGDADGDGTTVCGGDCDDNDASLNLNDEDGDGLTSCDGDCDDHDASLNLDDADGDGYTTCDGDCDDSDATLNLDDADGDGYTSCGGDCDDVDDGIHPDAVEICGDGIDQDCNGKDDGDCYGGDDDDDIGGGCECSNTTRTPRGTVPLAVVLGLGWLVVARRRRER